jgi:hypothetical protein
MGVPLGVIFPRCPHCRSVDFRSVGDRSALEAALHFILLPFRCALCGRHFFVCRWLLPADYAA